LTVWDQEGFLNVALVKIVANDLFCFFKYCNQSTITALVNQAVNLVKVDKNGALT
jgi:hypothetical protein